MSGSVDTIGQAALALVADSISPGKMPEVDTAWGVRNLQFTVGLEARASWVDGELVHHEEVGMTVELVAYRRVDR